MKSAPYHPDAGKSVRIGQDQFAFVPAPLPPSLTYSPDLVLALSRADAALGQLSGYARQLPDPAILIGSYVRREAVLSSRIEGTQADIADVLMDEANAPRQKAGAAAPDILEIRNYVAALDRGITLLKELPLSKRLARELHRILMHGVDNGRAGGGEFRRTQNWIGPAGSTLATAVHVPPPPQELHAALDAWEKFVNTRGSMPDLVQCALMHEQFEAIHPFIDGNGRVGRLLITLFLIERGRLSHPVLYLSEYIEAHRAEYYERLQQVRTRADWTGWLHYFLTGVATTAERAAALAQRLVDLRDETRRKVQAKPRALELVDRLFLNPYISASNLAAFMQISAPTARQLITYLEKEGVLTEITRRNWGRMWVAKGILDLLEGRAAKGK